MQCAECHSEYSDQDLPGGGCPHCLFQKATSMLGGEISCPHCGENIPMETDGEDSIICRKCGMILELKDLEDVHLVEDPIKRLGSYELIRMLGMGGFGSVWQALDLSLNRHVAVKLLKRTLLEGRKAKDRFYREGRISAQLRHPGIVSVYELTLLDEQPMIVSEFVHGVTLAAWMNSHRPQYEQSVKWVIAIAEAMDYAHRMGVIHRDLKPGNIIMEFPPSEKDETPKLGTHNKDLIPRVMDFGIAKMDSEFTLTMDGDVFGTPHYMSPEQLEGAHHADARSDIFSLGVILFELTTGRLPFQQSTQMVVHHILHTEFPKPSSLNPKTPRDLEIIILKCLEKDPSRRYASMGEFAADLQRWLDDEPIHARPIGDFERLLRWRRRHPLVAGLGLGLIVTFIAGFSITLVLLRQAEQERQKARQNYLRARTAVDEFLLNAEQKLKDTPGAQAQRKQLLAKAMEYYSDFVKENPEKDGLSQELAETYVRLAEISAAVDSRDKAIIYYEKAIEIFNQLIQGISKQNKLYPRLIETYTNLGDRYMTLGNSECAEASYKKAWSLCESVQIREEDRLNIKILQMDLSRRYTGFLRAYGRNIEAQEIIEQGLKLLEELQPRLSGDPLFRRLRRHLLAEEGSLLRMSQDYHSAVKQYNAVLGEGIEGSSLDERSSYAIILCRRAMILKHLDLMEKAWMDLEQAQGIYEQLSRENPDVTRYEYELGYIYSLQSEWKLDQKLYEEAVSYSERAITLFDKAARNQSADSSQYLMGRTYSTMAAAFYKLRNFNRSEESLQKAFAIFDFEYKQNPARFSTILELAQFHLNEAKIYSGMKNEKKSFAAYKNAGELFVKLNHLFPQDKSLIGFLDSIYARWSALLYKCNQKSEADQIYQKRVSLWKQDSAKLTQIEKEWQETMAKIDSKQSPAP